MRRESGILGFIYRNPKDLPLVPRILVRTVQFVLSAWTEFTRHHGPIRASGLAYSTLLALVPLVVVVFSFFSAVGGLETIRGQLQSVLFSILIPTRQEEILGYMNVFLENAQTLGFVGFVSLAVTSVFLLANIERNFNEIWGSTPSVFVLKRLTVYTSVLVLGTILVAASFLLTSWIDTFLRNLGIRQITVLAQIFVRIFPTLAMLAALVLMIMQVPAARVQPSSALIGGAVGAVLWEAAKVVFKMWVDSSVRNSLLYGSLAVIPIFLLWLYVAWNIILFALSASYVHQHIQRSTTENYIPVSCPSERLLVGMSVFLHIAASFHHGKPPPDIREITNRLLVSPSEIDSVLQLFIRNNLILPVEGQKACYVPARPLSSIRIREPVDLIVGSISEPMKKQFGKEVAAVALVSDFLDSAYTNLDGLTIDAIVDREPH